MFYTLIHYAEPLQILQAAYTKHTNKAD